MKANSEEHCIPYQISMDWEKVNIAIPEILKCITFKPIKRNAIGFIFDYAQVHLDHQSEQYIETKYIGFNVQSNLPEKSPQDIEGNSIGTLFIGYNNRLRGLVNKDADTKATIFANIAGTTKIFEFPYGQEISDLSKAQIDPDFFLDMFSLMNVSPSSNSQKYPILEPYNVQLIIVVERRNLKSNASLIIDALDVEATYSAPDENSA